MCTFWAVETAHGLLCGANRDESRLRGRGLPPSVQSIRAAEAGYDIEVLAPIDSDAGGTWIAANSHGLVVAMLNNYAAPSQQADAPIRSRGLLTLELAASCRPDDAIDRMQRRPDTLRHTRPFEAVIVAPGRTSQRAVWDGRSLVVEAMALPLVLASSAWQVEAVRTDRGAALPELVSRLRDAADVEMASAALQDAAANHSAGLGNRPTCLHRWRARTVSHTQVLVSSDVIGMRYIDGSPCRTAAGTWKHIERLVPVQMMR